MFRRPAIAFIATTCALVGSALLAPAAQADDVICTITETSPAVATIGVTAQVVQFGVRTDCDGTYPVSWSLGSDIYPGSSGGSWLLLRNFHRPTGEKFTYAENAQGDFTRNFIGAGTFQGNTMAGPHPLSASAFYDADGDGLTNNGELTTSYLGSFIAKRATTISGFGVSAVRRRARQTIHVTGSLQRANWDTGQYDGFAASVELQFRPDGGRYHDVKAVSDDGTTATTKVKVHTTGSWRYHYAGDDISGSSYSPSKRVVVRH
jgi:hypothetical protein